MTEEFGKQVPAGTGDKLEGFSQEGEVTPKSTVGLCITSSPALSSGFDDFERIETRQWYETAEFDRDFLILDSDISIPYGNGLASARKRQDLVDNLIRLNQNLLQYLKKGGVVVILTTPIENFDISGGTYNNYAWMSDLQSVVISNREEPLSISPESTRATILNYFKFVDVTSFSIVSVKETLHWDELAVSRGENHPLSVAVDTYIDEANYERDFEGSLVFLPRPKSIEGAADEIAESLKQAANSYRPNKRPDSESTLFDFTETETGPPEHVNLDNQLVDECLAPLQREEYHDAARRAGKVLEERVNGLAPDEITDGANGSGLMSEAFSADKGKIQFSEEDAEQEGVMYLAMGLMQAFRNPFSHRSPDPERERFLDDVNEQDAKAAIRISDFLLQQLSHAEIDTMENKPDSE